MTRIVKVFWIILCTLICSLSRQADADLIPGGRNVCSRQESFVESYMVSVQQSVTKQVSYKCRLYFFYKICYKNSVVYQVGYKQMYRVANRTFYMCCNGWKQIGNKCTKPICSQGCYNGTCIRPNVCTCLPGYHGATCNRSCPSNKWGPGCNNMCRCRNNATCDMRNGTCSCLPGWQGRTCYLPCQQDYYGNNCAQACTCVNGTTCDHVTGDCSCLPGWQGDLCNETCSLGYYGNKCQQNCRCQNNAKCDHVTGACSCTRGYQGIFCEKPCHLGFYGNRCQKKCQCEYGSCDHVSGTCTCTAGYTGPRCDERCPTNSYGINCSLPCSCPPNAICDPKDGSCSCKKGFIDDSCDDRCQSGHYGNQCQEKCSCKSDESCDPLNGNCTCQQENCREGLKSSKDKSSGSQNGPVIPTVVTVMVILIIIAIAITCLVYYKRRNQRMRDKPNIQEPVCEFSNASSINTAKKEKQATTYPLVTKGSTPTYMELKGNSERRSKDDVDKKGIQNPTYQQLMKKSRESGFSDVGSVAMETQYANFGSEKKSESVYQSLQKGSVVKDQCKKGDSEFNSGYQSLNRAFSDDTNVKFNPGYDPESTSLYETSTSVNSGDTKGNGDDSLYLELISGNNQSGDLAVLENQPYEILPLTGNDSRPIYDNL